MSSVYIASDTLNLNVPIGKPGYIVMIDPRIFTGLPYCVRVPSEAKDYWLPECDVVSAEEWISEESERVIRDSLIHHSLVYRDEALFKRESARRSGR